MLRQAAPPVKYKTLIIVESPSKCRTIEKYLGAAYTCIASCGHLREIANGLSGTGVSADTINEPTYAAIPKKMHYIRQIKTAIAECNGTVILGTDADREGEAIAWHICQLFHLPVETTPRIVFREITREALECAIRNPRVIDMALVRAQQARQILDLLIGYKTTPLLWGAAALDANSTSSANYNKYKKNKNSAITPALSAGRCQTPALRLVYDNDLAATAAAASPTYSYNCNAYFTGQNIAFSHSHPIELENIAAFLSFYAPPTANKIGECNRVAIQHIFSLDAVKRISQAPPSALKTSTLQQAASTILKFSPVDTMACAQSLYEKGFITYHRTDETRTSDEFRTSAAAYVAKTWGHDHATSVSQTIHSTAQSPSSPSSPHEGIRPIHVALSADKARILHRSELSANECRLYHLIWIRAVQSCMTPATCDKLTARIGARRRDANEDCAYAYTYVYHAYKPVFAGWRAVECNSNGLDWVDTEVDTEAADITGYINGSTDNFESMNTENRENPFHTGYKTYFDFLSNMRNGSIIPYNEIKCTTVLRSGAGRRYTEGGLVRRLEGLGIGRPSTFAAILHKLQKREYIVRRDVIRNIGTNFDCVDYSIAADGAVKVAGPKCAADTRREAASCAEFEFGTERNKLQLTDSGRVVIETLMRCCAPLFAYDYTKRMEDELDAVAMGNRDWRHVCRDCYDTITRCLDDAASVAAMTASVATAEPAAVGTGVLRTITKYASIRDGKYGAYIFYKTPKMKTPKFISLKGFSRNALTCDESLLSEWIDEH